MFPETIQLMNQEYIRIDNPNHFRDPSGNRRIGMPYWVALRSDVSVPDSPLMFFQEHLNQKTNTLLLVHCVEHGSIYLTRFDYDLSLANAQKLSQIKKHDPSQRIKPTQQIPRKKEALTA